MDRLKTRLCELYRRARNDPLRGALGVYAAGGAYHLFLSLGPLTALVLALLPYTSVTEQALFSALSGVIPPALGQLLRAVAQDVYARPPAAALGISLAAELWSAGLFLSSVVRAVSALSGAPASGYLRRRLLGAAFTLVLIAFLLGDLMLILFGGHLSDAVRQRWPGMSSPCRLLLRLRPLLLLLGLSAANTLLYRCPPGHQRAFPGAVLAAGAWLLFTRGYGLALERFGLFGVYGSIAAVIVTLYWAYCSLYILYIGAWLGRLLTTN